MIAFHPSLQAGDRDTFRLVYRFTDTVSGIENLELTSLFATKEVGRFYLMQLPDQLRKKGYLSASVDSVFWGDDAAMVNLFLGKQYKWLSLRVKEVDRSLLDASGYNEKKFNNDKTNSKNKLIFNIIIFRKIVCKINCYVINTKLFLNPVSDQISNVVIIKIVLSKKVIKCNVINIKIS